MSIPSKKSKKDSTIIASESIIYSETSEDIDTTESEKIIPKKAKSKAVSTNTYDLIIIGGGSAGLASAVEASKYNKRIAIFDYVHPTPHNTKWGLGGTCVNVGCIPKKLFHHAANVGHILNTETEMYGWEIGKRKQHNWATTIENIQNHIKSLNYGYKHDLKNNNIDYFNMYAKFIDPNTIECTNNKNEKKTFNAQQFIIAVGGRPKYPDIPGAELGITSDDLFSLPDAPNDTLIIGASYIALECASFLKHLNYNVTMMVRSVVLRGFDQQMANILMEQLELNTIRNSIPIKIDALPNGKKRVYYRSVGSKDNTSMEHIDVNTVVWAIGRDPQTLKLGLDNIGVKMDKENKIIVKNEQTNIPNIYALGDIISGGLELTTVAIMAGRLLIRRLYNKSKLQMNYKNVATTVFTTPVEYSCVGLSEESAIENFGEKDIEVYHTYTDPLEWKLLEKTNTCYIKLICNKISNKIVGLHILGPNSGEIIQGYSVAINMGATYEDFIQTVGIHPTLSEDVTNLTITKSSGEEPYKKSC